MTTVAHHPRHGDLILRYRHHQDAFFVLTIWGEAHEMTCVSYNEAYNLAKKSAESHNSDVWYTDDDLKFELLLTYRATS